MSHAERLALEAAAAKAGDVVPPFDFTVGVVLAALQNLTL